MLMLQTTLLKEVAGVLRSPEHPRGVLLLGEQEAQQGPPLEEHHQGDGQQGGQEHQDRHGNQRAVR